MKQYIITIMLNVALHCFCFVFAFHRVAKKMRMCFKMGADGHRFFMSSIRNELNSKVPSAGIYTTACSSDVCNIPTNGIFFVFSQ